MDIWFTSDTHYGHTNILTYQNRPFTTIHQHDEALITYHNELVKDRDIVYHLGDFCLGNPQHASRVYKTLNGLQYHLIKGNHDRVKNYGGLFTSIKDVLMLKLGPVRGARARQTNWIWLSHYAHARWPHAHHGAMHLFGHSHGGFQGLGRSMDVGVDTNNYRPYHIDEIRSLLKNVTPVEHHGED